MSILTYEPASDGGLAMTGPLGEDGIDDPQGVVRAARRGGLARLSDRRRRGDVLAVGAVVAARGAVGADGGGHSDTPARARSAAKEATRSASRLS